MGITTTLRITAAAIVLTSCSARAQTDLDQVIEKRASEVHWENVCGGKGRIDRSAVAAIQRADAKDRLIAKLDELRAASKTNKGLLSTCRRIQKAYGLERE
ncbi:MAG: hypothetical protein ACR2PG_21430 [Hyphomicrobiaceae bacterium]